MESNVAYANASYGEEVLGLHEHLPTMSTVECDQYNCLSNGNLPTRF
jgi:hypothetical protein